MAKPKRKQPAVRNKPSIEFTLGQLASDVKVLIGNEERAREHRAKTAETLSAMQIQMAGFSAVAAQVAEMRPHIEDYKRMKQRGLAIWLIVTLLGTAAGGWLLRKLGVPV